MSTGVTERNVSSLSNMKELEREIATQLEAMFWLFSGEILDDNDVE